MSSKKFVNVHAEKATNFLRNFHRKFVVIVKSTVEIS